MKRTHMKSQKELHLNRDILAMVSGPAQTAAQLLIKDEEVKHLQDYANVVSIKRLGYNDHGPVHMRKVAIISLTMAGLLRKARISLSLEQEGIGTYEDGTVAILLASFLHDIGMTIGRDGHEKNTAMLAMPILTRILAGVYPGTPAKQIVVRSLAIESMLGHMATQKIHSIEAGIVVIADGCDMEQGRARIPMLLATESRVGDIHKYSASAIEKVSIGPGDKKPIRITVVMNDSVGFFQIEEVLFTKINSSTIKPYIELYAGIAGSTMKCYL